MFPHIFQMAKVIPIFKNRKMEIKLTIIDQYLFYQVYQKSPFKLFWEI